jgi:hypothetical protein
MKADEGAVAQGGEQGVQPRRAEIWWRRIGGGLGLQVLHGLMGSVEAGFAGLGLWPGFFNT